MHFLGHTDKINSVLVSSFGQIYTGSNDRTLRKWHEFGECSESYTFEDAVTSLTLDEDEENIAVGLKNGVITIINLKDFKSIDDFEIVVLPA